MSLIRDIINLKNNIEINNCKIVNIDIGLSHNAPFSKRWKECLKNDIFIIGIEPNTKALNSLNQKEYIKNNANYLLIHGAVDDVKNICDKDFYMTTNDVGTSSLYKPIFEPKKGKNYIKHTEQITKVNCFPLYLLLERFPWEKKEYIDYLKVDAQGSDLNIIKSCKSYLDRIVYITLEDDGDQYEGSEYNNVDNITKYMNENNFVRIEHPNTNDPTFLNKKYTKKMNETFVLQLPYEWCNKPFNGIKYARIWKEEDGGNYKNRPHPECGGSMSPIR